MNIATTIAADFVETKRSLAMRLAAGDLSTLPQVDHPFYADSDFIEAAKMALDCDDFSELDFMVQRENGFQSFRNWQDGTRIEAVNHERNYADFDDWLDRDRSPRVTFGMGAGQ